MGSNRRWQTVDKVGNKFLQRGNILHVGKTFPTVGKHFPWWGFLLAWPPDSHPEGYPKGGVAGGHLSFVEAAQDRLCYG